jgi:hypothetical protein
MMSKLKSYLHKNLKPAKVHNATEAEREELFIWLIHWSHLSGVDICRTVMSWGITVFDGWFISCKETPFDGRLMTVGLPDGKLHHYAWGLSSGLIELTDEEYERCSDF